MPKAPQIPAERVEGCILSVRGQKVILDADIAALYGVSVGRLNEAVRRNLERFPSDFMFQLTAADGENLRSQIVTSNLAPGLKSQFAISKKGRGGRRSLPYAFTEHGVAMLSSVLRSPRAIQVNIELVRAFVKLRRMLASNADLTRKLEALEQKYDAQFKVVFDAIRRLMTPQIPRPRPIGFRPSPRSGGKPAGLGGRR
jgi:ORF6N domain